jgi:hypothetical protein
MGIVTWKLSNTYVPILSQKGIAIGFPIQACAAIVEHSKRDLGSNIESQYVNKGQPSTVRYSFIDFDILVI